MISNNRRRTAGHRAAASTARLTMIHAGRGRTIHERGIPIHPSDFVMRPPGLPPEPEQPDAAGGLFELERRSARWWHPLVILAALGALYVIGESLGWGRLLREMDRWIDSFGYLAPIVFIAIYIVVTVLGLPSSPLTAAAGVLFGAALGFAVAMTASITAATLSFLIARHLAPAWLSRRLGGSRTFRHLDRLVHQRGAMVVLATRLVGLLPFAVVNYGFGLTRIRLRTYVFWSILGKIPGLIVLVVGVDIVVEAINYQRFSWTQSALVLVIAAGLGLLVRRARRWLSDQSDDADPATPRQRPGSG